MAYLDDMPDDDMSDHPDHPENHNFESSEDNASKCRRCGVDARVHPKLPKSDDTNSIRYRI